MNGIRCHKQNDSPNRNDSSSFLKVVNDVEVERRAGGKLFHGRGPATMYVSLCASFLLLIFFLFSYFHHIMVNKDQYKHALRCVDARGPVMPAADIA